MSPHPDLRLLFATDLSETSLRASRALSSLAASCRIDVSFVHVARPDGSHVRAARTLRTFVTRAKPSYESRRLLLEAPDPVHAVADLCARARFDMVVAPPSERDSLVGVFGPSFRARLLGQSDVPLWSGGHEAAATAGRPLTAVGCIVDVDDAPELHLRQAWAFADRIGAALHVASSLPAIDDGTIARVAGSPAPLMPAEAAPWIRAMLPGAVLASLDISVGDRSAQVHRTLATHRPDVVFVGRRHWASMAWPLRYPRFLDRLAYPVICLDPARTEQAWSFQDAASWMSPDQRRVALASSGPAC